MYDIQMWTLIVWMQLAMMARKRWEKGVLLVVSFAMLLNSFLGA